MKVAFFLLFCKTNRSLPQNRLLANLKKVYQQIKRFFSMKKIVTLFVFAVMTVVSSFALTRGDVNSDGTVNVTDVTALVNRILGNASYSDALCDVDGNGTVNVSDVTTLVNIILGGDGGTKSFTVGGVSFEMVRVDGGTFTMGGTSEQGNEPDGNEVPVHQVTLSSYYIAKTEVTQALWEAVMNKSITQITAEKGWKTYGVGANYPMYDISWADCQEFISKLNALTGENFRMPTEAEWEYAARGGSKTLGYRYCGGNKVNDVGWNKDNSGSMTHPVASLAPNELGLYDMGGNVWEWCSDWFGSYQSTPQTNPTGGTSGTYRIVRGGSFYDYASWCRVSARFAIAPETRYFDQGLRLVLSE